MNVERLAETMDQHRKAPMSRVYTGGYKDCQKAMERDVAELAPAGYRVVSESYNMSWGAGVCVGCLSVEFAQGSPPLGIGSRDDDQETGHP
jgi:hypothetical protein